MGILPHNVLHYSPVVALGLCGWISFWLFLSPDGRNLAASWKHSFTHDWQPSYNTSYIRIKLWIIFEPTLFGTWLGLKLIIEWEEPRNVERVRDRCQGNMPMFIFRFLILCQWCWQAQVIAHSYLGQESRVSSLHLGFPIHSECSEVTQHSFFTYKKCASVGDFAYFTQPRYLWFP